MIKKNSFAAAGLWASALALPLGSTVAVARASPASAVCTSAQAGCVLPVRAAPAAATAVVEERGSSWVLPALLAAAALIAGIVLLSGSDDDEPVSR